MLTYINVNIKKKLALSLFFNKFADYQPIISTQKMGILNHVTVSIPDSVVYATKEVIFHSCKEAKSGIDVEIAKAITSSISSAIFYICVTIIACFFFTALFKYMDQKRRLEYESQKNKEDREMQVYKMSNDIAVHCIKEIIKKKKEGDVTETEIKMAEASQEYFKKVFDNTKVPDICSKAPGKSPKEPDADTLASDTTPE